MSQQQCASANPKSLMDLLANKDASIRQKARESLVALGKPAVSFLNQALQDSNSDQIRWEAAKALGAIGDASSIPSLVEALEDSDPDVAWLAAEALSEFKKTAWPSLFHELIKSGADSVLLRQRAHHVLRDQNEDGFNDLLATLREALESLTVPESTPIAAYNILKRMNATS